MGADAIGESGYPVGTDSGALGESAVVVRTETPPVDGDQLSGAKAGLLETSTLPARSMPAVAGGELVPSGPA